MELLIMIDSLGSEVPFSVKRMQPEEAASLLYTENVSEDVALSKSYNVKSDEERFSFLEKVLSKELSLKEVR